MDAHTTPDPPRHQDAALLRLGAALDRTLDAYWIAEDALRDGSEKAAAIIEQGWSVCEALAERICNHPAQTIDGLAVKARALAILGREEGVERDLVRVLARDASVGASALGVRSAGATSREGW